MSPERDAEQHILTPGPKAGENAAEASSLSSGREETESRIADDPDPGEPADVASENAAPHPLPSLPSLPSLEDEEEIPLPPSSSGEMRVTPLAVSEPSPAPVPDPEAAAPSGDISRDVPAEVPADGENPAPDTPAPRADGGGDDHLPPAVTHAQDAGQPAPPPNEEPMTLLDHLNELRRRLMRVVIVVILGFLACYGISEPMYAWLSAPLKACLPEGSKLIYTSPQGAFFVYLKVSLVASLFLTSPFSFYQVWAFIAPGLYREEKQAIMPLAFFSAFFFLAGALFCYFLVFPLAFRFFMGFATDVIVPMISVEEYLSFALKLLIAFGLVFEMPLFAYFLARLGVLTPEMMRRQRKYAVLGIFIVAAILTPPDVFSQCLMAAPMLLLYEVSVLVAARSKKGRDARLKKREAKKDGAGKKAPAEEAHGDV